MVGRLEEGVDGVEGVRVGLEVVVDAGALSAHAVTGGRGRGPGGGPRGPDGPLLGPLKGPLLGPLLGPKGPEGPVPGPRGPLGGPPGGPLGGPLGPESPLLGPEGPPKLILAESGGLPGGGPGRGMPPVLIMADRAESGGRADRGGGPGPGPGPGARGCDCAYAGPGDCACDWGREGRGGLRAVGGPVDVNDEASGRRLPLACTPRG